MSRITLAGISSPEISNMESLGCEFPPRSHTGAGEALRTGPIKGKLAPVAQHQPISKTFYIYTFCVMMSIATTYPSIISATVSFNERSTFYSNYSCSSNLICLGDAEDMRNSGTEDGRLSLIMNLDSRAGIAYYNTPVNLVNFNSTVPQSSSFRSSFVVDVVLHAQCHGDGMAFVISADNRTLGDPGGSLGIFNSYGATSFKSIVVELDGYQNPAAPEFDISDNHVSFDFSNIISSKAANASDVNVLLWSTTPIYAWVEYNNETSQLEARVSQNNSRPITPLLSYTVSLLDLVEEYMWVGFSAASSDCISSYYVGNWTFESNGIHASNWIFQPDGSRAHGYQKDDISPDLQIPTPLSDTSSSGLPTGVIIGLTVGGSFLALLAVIGYFARLEAESQKAEAGAEAFEQENPLKQIEGLLERFSYDELSEATRGFSEESKLGEGGFGSVYRGLLPSSGIPVAVKKISSESTQGEKEFMAEVSIINQSRHRNLIELRGWCKDSSRRQCLLVYELMVNGSVDRWLFRPFEEDPICLSWSLRFSIVTGTAGGLEYLHHMCKRQVIHRDIKCSNIMLDNEFNAKLGDFGLSRLVDHQDAAPTNSRFIDGTHGSTASQASDRTEKLTLLAGTPGYIAPEALVSPRCTDKTDVYAFGVVVLEVACGRRAYLRHLPREETILVDLVWNRMGEGELLSVVDNRLGDYDPKWMEVMLKVGLLCTHDDPDSRPSMKLVVKVLAGDAPVPPIPPRSSNRQKVSIHDLLRHSKASNDSKSKSDWSIEVASR